MTKQDAVLEAISTSGLLPLYFHTNLEESLGVIRTLYECGIRAVEYTNRGETALANFAAMRRVCDTEMKDLYLGIGTIKSAEAANAFMDAGADFLVSPVFDAGVADVAYLNKILWVPGCMTPTEIHESEKAGCRLVKLFPGNVLGPGFVGAVRDVFPGLMFMATGGVELEAENLRGWFSHGVFAVGMGSKLISRQIMDHKDYPALKAATNEAIRTIRAVRGR